MERTKETTVSIAQLAQRERAAAGIAYQQIVRQLSQISPTPSRTAENQTVAPVQEEKVATLKAVQTTKTPKSEKAARRQEMLRLFEKAAA